MIYEIEFTIRADKDLDTIDKTQVRRILRKIEALQVDLAGNVKHLTNFVPEYRLRVGNYRVLFAIENSKVIIYRIKHRRDAYD